MTNEKRKLEDIKNCIRKQVNMYTHNDYDTAINTK